MRCIVDHHDLVFKVNEEVSGAREAEKFIVVVLVAGKRLVGCLDLDELALVDL